MPIAKVTPAVQPVVRRTVLRRNKPPASVAADTALMEMQAKAQMQIIATLDGKIQKHEAAIALLRDDRAAAVEALQAAVKGMGKTGYSALGYEAKTVEIKGKSSTEYDIDKIKKALKLADFMSVIKVQAGELKKVMTEAEIAKVSTTTPGAVKSTVFNVDKITK